MAVHSIEDQEKPQIKPDVQNQLPEGTVLLGEGFLTTKVVLFTDEENKEDSQCGSVGCTQDAAKV